MGLAATHRFNDPLSGEGQHLVLQLSEEEAFAGPPLGIQPDRDGHRQRRLRQDQLQVEQSSWHQKYQSP